LPSLDIRNLGVRYATKTGTVEALSNINLAMTEGDFVVAIGASGCGKTTLLSCIAGFLPPTHGTIELDGKPVTGPGADRGVVFQKHALMPWLDVAQNVEFGLRMRGVAAAERRSAAMEQLRLVGLDEFADRPIYELSGGMQKRVALARAIAVEPEIVFFDEPTTGLDPIMADVINELIVKCVKELGATAISITHDMVSTRKIADRVAMIYDGKIIWNGPKSQIDNSGNPYVDQFIHGRATGPIKMQVRAY